MFGKSKIIRKLLKEIVELNQLLIGYRNNFDLKNKKIAELRFKDIQNEKTIEELNNIIENMIRKGEKNDTKRTKIKK